MILILLSVFGLTYLWADYARTSYDMGVALGPAAVCLVVFLGYLLRCILFGRPRLALQHNDRRKVRRIILEEEL